MVYFIYCITPIDHVPNAQGLGGRHLCLPTNPLLYVFFTLSMYNAADDLLAGRSVLS
jgi:hypothetical protein